MTLHFIEEFKKGNQCGQCKKNAGAKSLCPEHLNKAKLRFRVWAATRKIQGLCLHCNRKGYKGQCRCYVHTLKNQIRCKEWYKLHGAEKRQQELDKMAETGLCLKCSAHNPLRPGHQQCQACFDKHSIRGKATRLLARLAKQGIY